MSYLPSVVSAEYVSGYVVKLKFNDGTRKAVDISQWFKGPVFEPLQQVSLFQQFFIDAGTIAWPNGVDIAPEALYDAEDVQKAA